MVEKERNKNKNKKKIETSVQSKRSKRTQMVFGGMRCIGRKRPGASRVARQITSLNCPSEILHEQCTRVPT